MSKTKKRTRVTPKRTGASSITIREHHEIKNGTGYLSFMVQGWQEEGKWKRKKFKLRKDAERFAALKSIEVENQGRAQRMVMTPLSETQMQEALEAFDELGSTYSLKEAVRFFLKNHRSPDFTIHISQGVKLYSDDRERQGVRARTIKQSESVLKQLVAALGDPFVHEVTPQRVELFLRDLRAKDGVSPAKRKTWNNYRNDLSHFFTWASTADLGTQRPWVFLNPVEKVRAFSAKQVSEQKSETVTTTPDDVQQMFTALMRWRGGALVKCFALAYFAGIRPDGELKRLAARESELVNLKTGVINIPANVSKTKEARQIIITKNLAAWLDAYKDAPILPTNFDRLMKEARSHFKISHDETRHSFISYHVALHRSVGDAALQAGNSESIVKKHYLNLHPKEEGAKFFSLVPDPASRRAIESVNVANSENEKLRAI